MIIVFRSAATSLSPKSFPFIRISGHTRGVKKGETGGGRKSFVSKTGFPRFPMRNLPALVAFRLVASEEKGRKEGGAKTKKIWWRTQEQLLHCKHGEKKLKRE